MKKRREQRESKKKVEERVQLTSSSSTIQHALHNCRNSSVDRISDLPDELLIYILSFLPTKLAFTTAILSKRWTQLCYSLPIIDLSYKTITKCRTLKRFRCFVNNIMLSPVSTNQPMKIFRFKCLLRYHQRNSKFNVTKWLEAAKQRHIEEIHLSLPSHTLMPDLFVSQTLVVLKLESLYVGKGTSCVHLPSLKTLNLTSVYFLNWNNYVNFLYACPILEDLYAEPIHFIRFDENNASEEGIKSLTLSKLVRASIRIRDGVVNGINNVKFLRVLICAKAFSLNAIPLFENLISMELVFPRCSYICWDDVVELLRHCPKLQILFIEKRWLNSSSKEWKCPISVLECVSSHLRSCTILNIDCTIDDIRLANDIRFAKYILQNVGILQDMTIGITSNITKNFQSKIREELSSYPRISRGYKLSFELKYNRDGDLWY